MNSHEPVIYGQAEPSHRVKARAVVELWRHLSTTGRIIIASALGAVLITGSAAAFWLSSRDTPNATSSKGTVTTQSNGQKGSSKTAADTSKTDPKSSSPTAPSKSSNGSQQSSSGGSSNGGGSTSGSGNSVTSACSGGTHVAGGSDGAGGCWPGPNNTGVPAGTVLSTYGGPCTITTAGTVIDSKTVNCDMSIQAANVTIKNSKINGLVTLDTDLPGSSGWSMTIQDTEVDGGQVQRAAVSVGNMTVIRANIHGGITAAQCDETSASCTIQDSWLHGQYIPDNANWHLGGFLSDGGTNMTLTHNTVVCDHAANNVGEGCTGDINFIPNFASITQTLVEHNLLGANTGSAYCTYGGEKSTSPTPHSNHLIYKDNVFQRGSNSNCAGYGPVTNFDINQPGNQWINNKWDDGATVDPVN